MIYALWISPVFDEINQETLMTVEMIAVAVFGLFGVVALSVVPWICIGTGLKDPDQDYIN